jgi:hypothetical protein
MIEKQYHQLRLDILRAETEEEKEQVKESIRAYEKENEDPVLAGDLWDFYDLIINKKVN